MSIIAGHLSRKFHRARIGARLVAEFLARAEAWGAWQAEVAACSANPETLRFYERRRFGAHAGHCGRP